MRGKEILIDARSLPQRYKKEKERHRSVRCWLQPLFHLLIQNLFFYRSHLVWLLSRIVPWSLVCPFLCSPKGPLLPFSSAEKLVRSNPGRWNSWVKKTFYVSRIPMTWVIGVLCLFCNRKEATQQETQFWHEGSRRSIVISTSKRERVCFCSLLIIVLGALLISKCTGLKPLSSTNTSNSNWACACPLSIFNDEHWWPFLLNFLRQLTEIFLNPPMSYFIIIQYV